MQISESLLCTAIVEQACEAVIFADRAGLIRIWNRGAEALFGFSAGEAIGASLDIIVPERFRSAHWSGFHQAIESGRTQHGGEVRTTRGLHKDGRKLYVELSFGLITTPAGEVAGSLAIGRPGNERFAKDAGLQARIAALQTELAGLRRPGDAGGAEGRQSHLGRPSAALAFLQDRFAKDERALFSRPNFARDCLSCHALGERVTRQKFCAGTGRARPARACPTKAR